MRRLMVKELRENWIWGAGLLLILGIFAALGDPLTFRENSIISGYTPLAFLPALVMGLGMYSREFSRDTLGFVLSRPIRWWWLYLSKVLAGVGICFTVSILLAAVYCVSCPSLYRPFIDAPALAHGVLALGGTLAIIFAMGLAFSCVLPGIAPSFGIGAAIYLLFAVITIRIMETFPTGSHYFIFIFPATLAAANILAVRAPLVLMPLRRIKLWSKVLGGGMATMVLATVIMQFTGLWPDAGGSNSYSGSPNGKYTAVWPRPDFPKSPDKLLLETENGRRVLIEDKRTWLIPAEWSPEGNTFYYFSSEDGAILKSASVGDDWRPKRVCELPRLPAADKQLGPSSPYDSYYQHEQFHWSPMGRRLAFWIDDREFSPAEKGGRLIVIDTQLHRSMLAQSSATRDFWWAKEDLIVMLDEFGRPKQVQIQF